MNFPMQEPFYQFLYWLANTPGLGGLAVSLLAVVSIAGILLALRWIAVAKNLPETETYSYPTPALHHESAS